VLLPSKADDIWRVDLVGPAHSALMPSSLIIGHHFSASAFAISPSDPGVCRSRGKISCPSSRSLDCTVGSARVSTVAALILATTSLDVPRGAKSPNQSENEIDDNPNSRKVGMSGASAYAFHLSPRKL
jgi:hypothetical protein